MLQGQYEEACVKHVVLSIDLFSQTVKISRRREAEPLCVYFVVIWKDFRRIQFIVVLMIQKTSLRIGETFYSLSGFLNYKTHGQDLQGLIFNLFVPILGTFSMIVVSTCQIFIYGNFYFVKNKLIAFRKVFPHFHTNCLEVWGTSIFNCRQCSKFTAFHLSSFHLSHGFQVTSKLFAST